MQEGAQVLQAVREEGTRQDGLPDLVTIGPTSRGHILVSQWQVWSAWPQT